MFQELRTGSDDLINVQKYFLEYLSLSNIVKFFLQSLVNPVGS